MGQRHFASGRHDAKEILKVVDSALDLSLPFQVVGSVSDDSDEVAVSVFWGEDAYASEAGND